MNMKKTLLPMVLLDCETTGGKAIYHRIIEIGLIVIEGGEIVEGY
jgi:DNA polymerase III epsilon subunit-like protein|tara:strand:- start:1551 stop:1685 length:135 start_codon:yes stop_codon:yes gene_type:complete